MNHPRVMARSLERTSTVDALAAALRKRILDGELAPAERLVERELVDDYDVARHTVRSALRALASEGLVQLVPDKGARVAQLDEAAIRGLFELRGALELEAAHRALARGPLPPSNRQAVAALREICARPAPAWSAVVDAHEGVHRALVAAGGSARILAAYDALAAEMKLFVVALRPHWSLAQMADHHDTLIDALERDGVSALRRHLAEGEATVLAGLAGGAATPPADRS